ncbi:Posterior sex combs [Carabus blaptoides fortunei]
MINPRRILVKDLNDNLICSLCGGYLVDATSVIDCSHTFCRACIVRHFESSRFCPNCGSLVHKSKPLSKLRSDTTLQTLIYKVVPSLYSKELQRRADFYHSTGFRANSSCSDDSILGDRTQDSEEWVLSNIGDPSLYFSPDDSISLSVEYYRNEQEEDNASETKYAIKTESDISTESCVQIDTLSNNIVKTDNNPCETVKLETKITEKPSTVVENSSGNVANGSCSTVSASSNVANTSTNIVNVLNNIANTLCNVVNTSCNVANTSCNVANTSCNVANTSCNVANTSCSVANTSCNVASTSCNVANSSCSVASTSCNLAGASDGNATDSAVLANGSVNVDSNSQTVTNCSATLVPESNNDNGSGDCGNFANPTVEDVKNIGHKRFLRCPAAVRMNHLMKFLRMKFALSNEHRVDIIYSGEVLPPYLSLMDVAYTFKWNREHPMRFFYLIYIPVARPVLPQQTAIVPPTIATMPLSVMKVELIPETENPTDIVANESSVKKLKDTKIKDVIKSEMEDKKDNNNVKPVQKSVKFFDDKPTNSESKVTQKSVKFVENNFKPFNNYGMLPKSFEYKMKNNDVEQSSSTENCVYDYTEPDKDEIKAFAERRDREWALQKHVEPEIHISKKRKKNKHSKNETYKKHKLHAEITSNEISSKPDDSLKLKVKLSLANGHKHKHRSNSSSSSSSIAIVEPIKTHELSPKEKLLQMRQVRHKNITPPVLDDKFKHVTPETSSYKIVPSTEKLPEKPEVITEKVEPVIKRPEPPPKRLEPVMKKSEPIMKKSEQIMKKPEPIMKKPEPIMKKPEPIMKKPEPIMKKPELIMKKPESVMKKPEAIIKKPEPIVKKPESNMKRPESVSKKADVPVRKPESITSVTERVPKTPERVTKVPERAADILSTGKTLRSDFSFKTSMSKDICNKYVRVNLEKCTDNKMLSQKKNIVGNNLTIRNIEKNETVSNADKNRVVESKTEIIAIENKTTDNKLSDNKSTDKLPIIKVPDNKQDSKKNIANVTETKKEQNVDTRNTDSKTIENKLNNIDFKTSQSSTLVTKNFTVSKVETGVKRPLENPDMSAEKRPSLEITVINLVSRPPPTSSIQTNSIQTKPASNTQTKHTISMTNDGPPAKKIRPPPLTIPLTRIQKMNIKTNMPKPLEKCDTFGPLDLSAKPNKIDIKPNEVRSNSVSPKPKIQDSILNLIRPRTPIKNSTEFVKLESGKSTDKAQFSDKRPNISNLQLLSESATQIRELMMLKNSPTTLPVPNLIKKTPTNSSQNAAFKSPDFLSKNPNFLPKTPCLIPKNPATMNKSPNFLPKGTNFLPKNLQKLPKLNEINKGQFSRLNASQQLRSPRPAGQNQSIRNIPNPSLLVRQNRINSLNNTSTNLSSSNSITNKPDTNVEMSSAKMNTVKPNLTETAEIEKKPETKASEPPPLKPIETYKK